MRPRLGFINRTSKVTASFRLPSVPFVTTSAIRVFVAAVTCRAFRMIAPASRGSAPAARRRAFPRVGAGLAAGEAAAEAGAAGAAPEDPLPFVHFELLYSRRGAGPIRLWCAPKTGDRNGRFSVL